MYGVPALCPFVLLVAPALKYADRWQQGPVLHSAVHGHSAGLLVRAHVPGLDSTRCGWHAFVNVLCHSAVVHERTRQANNALVWQQLMSAPRRHAGSVGTAVSLAVCSRCLIQDVATTAAGLQTASVGGMAPPAPPIAPPGDLSAPMGELQVNNLAWQSLVICSAIVSKPHVAWISLSVCYRYALPGLGN